MTLINTETYPIEREFDAAKVILEVSALAEKIGFSLSDKTKIKTAVSELSKNILHHAQSGKITINLITDGVKQGIEIIADDKGPGIKDIDQACTERFSTKNSLGLGLSAIKRLMDECEINSQLGIGTSIIVRKWL